MNLHVLHQGQQVGPLDEAALRARLAAGALGPDDLAWHEGLPGWKPLREVHPALFASAASPTALPPPLVTGPAPAMSTGFPPAGTAPGTAGTAGMPTWVKVLIGSGVAAILLLFIAISVTGYVLYHRGQAVAQRARTTLGEVKRTIEAETLHAEGFALYEAKDYAGARPLFERAAELGHAQSQHNLGVMSLYGQGAPQDPKSALAWFEQAAAQGFASSQGQVGLCYSFHEGLPRDYPRAVEWFRKAAEQDEPQAVNNLAAMYEDGLGVPRDLAKAREGYQRALKLGYAPAKQNLERLDRPPAPAAAVVAKTTPAPAPTAAATPFADDPPPSPPPAPPAGSPFTGRWQGPWKDTGTGQNGTFTFTVAADGTFQGETRNDTGKVSGPVRGTLNREGDLRATYSYRTGDGAGAYAMAGKLIRQPDRLLGKVIFFSGKERIGAATVDLAGGDDGSRPAGR